MSSIVAITNQFGTIVEKRHFDAWGTAVKIMDGQGQVLNQLTFTDRGYTGHEHLQGINIIQMNGRLYDPHLRRFMAPDNYERLLNIWYGDYMKLPPKEKQVSHHLYKAWWKER